MSIHLVARLVRQWMTKEQTSQTSRLVRRMIKRGPVFCSLVELIFFERALEGENILSFLSPTPLRFGSFIFNFWRLKFDELKTKYRVCMQTKIYIELYPFS